MSASSNQHDLKSANVHEIQEAFEFQQSNSNWDLYSEREFLENLLTQRLNFFFTIFALIITAACSVSGLNLKIVTGLGFAFLSILIYPMERLFRRFDIVLKMLYKLEDKHTMKVIQREMDFTGTKPQVKIIYYWIPLICVIFLIILFCLSLSGIFTGSKN